MNHTISCPGCGRAVDIPDGMDACFCTFCGTKVARPASPAPSAGEASPRDAAALAQELAELMVHRRALAHQLFVWNPPWRIEVTAPPLWRR